MPARTEPPDPERLERRLRGSDPSGLELSIVDLVLLACELSEDSGEVDDLVRAAVRTGAARVLPRERDPMLVRAA